MRPTSLSYSTGHNQPTGPYCYPVPRSDSVSSLKPDPKRPKLTLKIEPALLPEQKSKQGLLPWSAGRRLRRARMSI